MKEYVISEIKRQLKEEEDKYEHAIAFIMDDNLNHLDAVMQAANGDIKSTYHPLELKIDMSYYGEQRYPIKALMARVFEFNATEDAVLFKLNMGKSILDNLQLEQLTISGEYQ